MNKIYFVHIKLKTMDAVTKIENVQKWMFYPSAKQPPVEPDTQFFDVFSNLSYVSHIRYFRSAVVALQDFLHFTDITLKLEYVKLHVYKMTDAWFMSGRKGLELQTHSAHYEFPSINQWIDSKREYSVDIMAFARLMQNRTQEVGSVDLTPVLDVIPDINDPLTFPLFEQPERGIICRYTIDDTTYDGNSSTLATILQECYTGPKILTVEISDKTDNENHYVHVARRIWWLKQGNVRELLGRQIDPRAVLFPKESVRPTVRIRRRPTARPWLSPFKRAKPQLRLVRRVRRKTPNNLGRTQLSGIHGLSFVYQRDLDSALARYVVRHKYYRTFEFQEATMRVLRANSSVCNSTNVLRVRVSGGNAYLNDLHTRHKRGNTPYYKAKEFRERIKSCGDRPVSIIISANIKVSLSENHNLFEEHLNWLYIYTRIDVNGHKTRHVEHFDPHGRLFIDDRKNVRGAIVKDLVKPLGLELHSIHDHICGAQVRTDSCALWNNMYMFLRVMQPTMTPEDIIKYIVMSAQSDNEVPIEYVTKIIAATNAGDYTDMINNLFPAPNRPAPIHQPIDIQPAPIHQPIVIQPAPIHQPIVIQDEEYDA